MSKFKIAIIVYCLQVSSYSEELDSKKYIVKRGDTLSNIAENFYPPFIYGDTGSLKLLINFNTHLPDPHNIEPGQIIYLKDFPSHHLYENLFSGMTPPNDGKIKRNLAGVQGKAEAKKQKSKSYVTRKEYKKQSFSIGLFTGIASIASTDKSSNVTEKAVTDLGYGAFGTWSHHYSDFTRFFIIGSAKKFKFRPGAGRSLKNSDSSKFYIGIGANFKLSDRISSSLGAGIGQSLILSSNGASQLEINKANIPTASFSLTFELLKIDSKYSFYGQTRVGALFASSQDTYSTKFGHYGNFSLGSRMVYQSRIYFFEFSYTLRKLEAGQADQTSKELGFSLGTGWEF